MGTGKIAILHYSSSPVIGGVESVIDAHVKLFIQAGYDTTVIAGRGSRDALPPGANFVSFPEIDSQYPSINGINSSLETGKIPPGFDQMVELISEKLAPVLVEFDHLIIHNVFSKHFNLPLTAALSRLLDQRIIHHCLVPRFHLDQPQFPGQSSPRLPLGLAAHPALRHNLCCGIQAPPGGTRWTLQLPGGSNQGGLQRGRSR
ncbi:hypothetical protein ACFLUC_02475 [Chloroflexota bacterium]